MSSQDDIPPRRREFCSKISHGILYSLFLLGIFIVYRQEIQAVELIRPKINSSNVKESFLESKEYEETFYIRRMKKIQITKRLNLEPPETSELEFRCNRKETKKLSIQLILIRDFDYVITYIQDQDGKKRAYFLL